jgi:hypothetical protein
MMAPWCCHLRGSAFQKKSARLEVVAAAGEREVLGNSAKAVEVETLTPVPAPSASFLLDDAAAEMATARVPAEKVQKQLGARKNKKWRRRLGRKWAWKWAASPLARCLGKPRLLPGRLEEWHAMAADAM